MTSYQYFLLVRGVLRVENPINDVLPAKMVNNFCLRPLLRIQSQLLLSPPQSFPVSSAFVFNDFKRTIRKYENGNGSNRHQQQRQLFSIADNNSRRDFGLLLKAHAPLSSVRFSQHLRPPSHHPPYLRIDNEADAHELVSYLLKHEREHLQKVLNDRLGVAATKDGVALGADKLTPEQTKAIFLSSVLPFIGFGILDNLLMIIAGEYIDNTMGVVFGLSTMAAAGLGNILSDIAGVGSAHYVEFMVSKFFGVKPPALTANQWDSSKVRWTTNGGRCFGLVIGCLIGMFPLLFFDETGKQEKKLQSKKAA